MDPSSVIEVLMDATERVVKGRDRAHDVMLLRIIQHEIVTLAAEHDCPSFIRCARVVYARPGVLLSALLNSDIEPLRYLITEACSDASEVVGVTGDIAGENNAEDSKSHDPEPEANEPVHEIGLEHGHGHRHGHRHKTPNVERQRRRVKRMLADNLRDSFF